MAHTSASVEDWLDANPDVMADYFLRKADIGLVNRWLTQHGLNALPEMSPVIGKHVSLSADSSAPSSPVDTRFGESGFFESRHHRSNSKKYLRQDFARSKMKNMFRTYEPTPDSSAESRRSSLKEMRQFRSLPPTSVNMLSLLIQSKVRLPRYPSKDIDHKRELRYTNERAFFLEIVKDISNDLDLKSLSSKMVANMCCLTDADKASLFLVEGRHGGRPSLVSKIFDVHAGTSILPSTSGDTRIPWGQGIIGHVAQTGEMVSLRNAMEDPRYNDEIAQMTGYKVESLLCHPIRNAEDEIVGVAQLLNKTTGDGFFNQDDETLLATYLTFCGIAIYNAQLFDAYSKEYERNKALLEVVHDLFEEQTSVENAVLKIMQRAQTLLKVERCSVLLRDSTSEMCFNKIFDLSFPIKNGHSHNSADSCHDLKLGNKIAELVLITGETINITDASQDPRFDSELDRVSGMHTRSILCKPVRKRDAQIIGVAQVVNKVDGQPFDDYDDQLFEAFVIFCGLGINNCQLYEEVSLSAARQAVALEVLSYHTSAPSDEVSKIKSQRIPEAYEWRLPELNFNDFSLDRDQMMLAAARIFYDLGLIRKLRLDYETLCRWLLTVRRNYRNVAYHNWRHAFNVCQVMFATMMKCNTRRHLTDNEVLALIVGCLCHDLDHRGTNNAFQHKSSSALCQLYGTKATLEHHHFNHAIMILNSEGHNLLANLGSEDYADVINLLKQAILATDLSIHIQIRQKFFAMVDAGQRSWDDRESKEIYRSMLMTACDIAAITKPWDVQRRAADLVVTEFFDQGDKEKNELKLQPQACMDREKQDEVASLQLAWIDGICLPLYKALSKMECSFRPMLEGVLNNRARWEHMDAERLSKHAILETGV
ncbi:dual 3',5'-cyclic-AMP and -GMP phosphodiesterase 11A-like isoform X2 [Pomacea canaliculata]|uniref:dual 3',5'-cyclic-AMP and -GMP phosphodiesterase 11A-like isoform X2 n=1 Tax=Pomacea canaliculata TaxID=400727 RepID=UPI000D72DE23|nr:dual 3',5'-cyclic-AMP and -GMP phosphodiesterase 11A-like isoform X2 [Pomacea canaliculata]